MCYKNKIDLTCARGISSQRSKPDAWGSLHVDTVENLIRISMEKPSILDFDAKEAVDYWLNQAGSIHNEAWLQVLANTRTLAPTNGRSFIEVLMHKCLYL